MDLCVLALDTKFVEDRRGGGGWGGSTFKVCPYLKDRKRVGIRVVDWVTYRVLSTSYLQKLTYLLK